MVDQPKDTEKPLSMRALTEKVAAGVSVLVADVEKRNAPKAEAPRPAYTEADALRDCINALQKLQNEGARPSSSYAQTISYSGSPGWDTGDRVLRFLAARFNVNLIEVRQPDCHRAHLDTLDPTRLASALSAAAVSR